MPRPEDWNMTSYIMEHHQRSGSGNGLMIGQMTDTFRMPKDFPSLVYLSHGAAGRRHPLRGRALAAQQAPRQRHPVLAAERLLAGGLLGQPGLLRPLESPALCRPPLLRPGDALAVRRRPEDRRARDQRHRRTRDRQVQWQLLSRWMGAVLQSGEAPVQVEPYQSKEITAATFDLSEEQRRRTVFVCSLSRAGKVVDTRLARLYPTNISSWHNPPSRLMCSAENDQVVFTVSARSLARFVELSLEGADVVFSDNYFDVPVGWTVTVTAPIPAGWSLDQVKQALRVVSLYELF